jgi:hypothetical protein
MSSNGKSGPPEIDAFVFVVRMFKKLGFGCFVIGVG